MDLRIGFGLGLYYLILAMVFVGINGFATAYGLPDINATSNIDINTSEITSDEIDVGGFFTIGVSFDRFLNWSSFAVFLPDNTPEWFTVLFIVFQGLMNLLAIMWIIASIWNG